MPDFPKQDEHRSCVIGRVLSTSRPRSSYSEDLMASDDELFESFIAPFLNPTPYEDISLLHVSFLCDDNTPVEISWMFKSTGEIPVQYGIETLFASSGSPIPTPQNLVILRNPFTTSQCPGFHLSWSHECTRSHLHSSCSPPCAPQPQSRSSLPTFQCQTCPPSLSTLPLGDGLDAIQKVVCPIPSYLEAAARMMDTAENPSHPQRTQPSIINSSPPLVALLYNTLCVADMSVAELISNIRTFIHSPPLIAVARNLRGEEAQGFIELIDQVGDAWF